MRPNARTPAYTAGMDAARIKRKLILLSQRCGGSDRRFLQRSRYAQRGFSIVAAIFILVVLAGLGGFLVSTSSTQHMTQALDAMNARAHQAARTGIEWGVYQVVKVAHAGGNYPELCDGGPGFAGAATTQTLAGVAGIAEFKITVECRSQAYDEAGVIYRVYQLVATACNGDDATCPDTTPPPVGYVEHQQSATVRWP